MDEQTHQNDQHSTAADLKAHAKSLGFDLAGIAPAAASRYREYLKQWLDDGQAGTMEYLARRFEERADPRAYLPQAASVLCVAMNYHVPLEQIPESDAGHHGKIARYALGNDYHEIITPRLHALADWMHQRWPACQTKCAVDTAPVLEKELAAQAGVGWIGKNTCIINTHIGSWLLLGEIITTLDLPPDTPAIDRCGTCRRCIDACPTNAITAPYQLDARRCISYLTIEHRGDIPADLREKLSGWLYGCDICQEVCPWNNHAPATTDPAMTPRFPTATLNLHEVLNWGTEEYRTNFRRSAMKRVKLKVLQGNAQILLAEAQRSGR